LFFKVAYPFGDPGGDYIYLEKIQIGETNDNNIILFWPAKGEYYLLNIRRKIWENIKIEQFININKTNDIKFRKLSKVLIIGTQKWTTYYDVIKVEKNKKTFIIPTNAEYGITEIKKYVIGFNNNNMVFINTSKVDKLPDSTYYYYINDIINLNSSLTPLRLLLDNEMFPRQVPGILEQIHFYTYIAKLCRSIYTNMPRNLVFTIPRLSNEVVDTIKQAILNKYLTEDEYESAYYLLMPLSLYRLQPESTLHYWQLFKSKYKDSPYMDAIEKGGINTIKLYMDSLVFLNSQAMPDYIKQWKKIEYYDKMLRVDWNYINEISYDMSAVINMLKDYASKYPESKYAISAREALVEYDLCPRFYENDNPDKEDILHAADEYIFLAWLYPDSENYDSYIDRARSFLDQYNDIIGDSVHEADISKLFDNYRRLIEAIKQNEEKTIFINSTKKQALKYLMLTKRKEDKLTLDGYLKYINSITGKKRR